MSLCLDKRGILSRQVYLTPYRVELSFELPLAEIVFDFYDRLKSISRGYASFDYALIDYRASDLIKLDIKLDDIVMFSVGNFNLSYQGEPSVDIFKLKCDKK